MQFVYVKWWHLYSNHCHCQGYCLPLLDVGKIQPLCHLAQSYLAAIPDDSAAANLAADPAVDAADAAAVADGASLAADADALLLGCCRTRTSSFYSWGTSL